MSGIDFQNGFVCGMATRGLTKSGTLYQPLCWNDSGVYTYFYINFKRAMREFSLGMFNESILVYDSTQIFVDFIEPVSAGVYKIHCDISGRIHGITVLNKKTSRLRFSSGERLPVFSIHMFVSGLEEYIDADYAYHSARAPAPGWWPAPIISSNVFLSEVLPAGAEESAVFPSPAWPVTEAASVLLK